jgi:NAD(P)-dependent dehydrogenase (short-subunit alcohol dehydrogenase family)
MTSFRLDGLRALITAGGSGIGRVIAKCLFEAGARVHTCDIQAKLLDACSGEFPGIGTTVATYLMIAPLIICLPMFGET